MNILTFDIEDWYCHDNYSQNFEWEKFEVRIYEPLEKILQSLDEKQIKATFFCLGWLADHHPKVIRDIAELGHQIGCHSYQHQLSFRLNYKEFHEDTYRAKSVLEDVSGKEVSCFRAPSYSITSENPYAFEVLAKLGFTHDSSVFPINRECGGFKDYGEAIPKIIKYNGYTIKEFPMNTYKFLFNDVVFSGGGYFRILPYFMIKHWANKSDYIMSYFHPSDFDPHQPKMKHLPLMRQFKNEIGLKGAFDKFKKYINDNSFMSIKEADKAIDWSTIKEIVIKQ